MLRLLFSTPWCKHYWLQDCYLRSASIARCDIRSRLNLASQPSIPRRIFRKNTKKTCQNFLRLINAPSNHTQTGKSVDAPWRFRYSGAPYSNSIHINIQLHEKEICFKICLF